MYADDHFTCGWPVRTRLAVVEDVLGVPADVVVATGWRPTSRRGWSGCGRPCTGSSPAARAASSRSCGFFDPVVVGVRADLLPGARDELHRPDRPVEARVAVEQAPVGVDDPHPAAAAVQRQADDLRQGLARPAQPGAVGARRARTRPCRSRRAWSSSARSCGWSGRAPARRSRTPAWPPPGRRPWRRPAGPSRRARPPGVRRSPARWAARRSGAARWAVPRSGAARWAGAPRRAGRTARAARRPSSGATEASTATGRGARTVAGTSSAPAAAVAATRASRKSPGRVSAAAGPPRPGPGRPDRGHRRLAGRRQPYRVRERHPPAATGEVGGRRHGRTVHLGLRGPRGFRGRGRRGAVGRRAVDVVAAPSSVGRRGSGVAGGRGAVGSRGVSGGRALSAGGLPRPGQRHGLLGGGRGRGGAVGGGRRGAGGLGGLRAQPGPTGAGQGPRRRVGRRAGLGERPVHRRGRSQRPHPGSVLAVHHPSSITHARAERQARTYPGAMPRYEFRCRACGDTFEVNRPMARGRRAGRPAPRGTPTRSSCCPPSRSPAAVARAAPAVAAPAPAGGGCCGGACGC